jgi:myo-inositol-1(or 4)-monophosphatase
METLLTDTIKVARAAGAVIMDYYRDSFSVTDKSPDNPVTDADLAADRLLHERLKALFPEAGWLSEETVDSPERLDKEFVWVVDPLDGTKEFVMGIPEFAVSVALVRNGVPELAVIFNPASDELFHAQRGKGAFSGNTTARVSDRATLRAARVDASRSERKRGGFLPFEALVQVETVGSIAYKLARVGAGLCDATWSRGPKNEWDICAGVLVVQEGGGRCVNLDDQIFAFNRPSPKVNGIIATNGHIHEEVLLALAPHRATARAK